MATDNIFKFVSSRPPHPPSKSKILKGFVKFSEEQKSSFHQMVEAIQSDDRREKAKELAKEYFNKKEYNPDLSQEIELIEDLTSASQVSDAKKLFEELLGEDIDKYLNKNETLEKWEQLWNSLYAQSLLPNEKPQDRDNIYNGIRFLHYLNLIKDQKDDEKPISKSDFLRIKPIIPTGLIPEKIIDTSLSLEEEQSKKNVIEKFKVLYVELKNMRDSIENLRNVEVKFRAEKQREIAVEGSNLSQLGKEILQEYKVLALKTPIIKNLVIGSVPLQPSVSLSKETVAIETNSVVIPSQKPWVFEDFGTRNLKLTTKEIINKYNDEFDELESSQIVASLESKMAANVKKFFQETPKSLLPYISGLSEFQWIASKVPLTVNMKPSKSVYIAPGSPTARGIKPLGIGDLMVIKQELQKYASGEVAHVENILKSENKNRTHTRIRETEEILITETEQIEESERDLQTTERFELQKEAQKTIESDMSIEAGLSVTVSYGVVTATAYGDFAYNQSSSESTKNASNYAKDVVDRSISRIQQRAREERIRRSLERFEEKNEHGFDNKAGSDHVIGVYRWVDKYYKARVINYGKRLMIEFIIPEPAAFYIYTQENKELKGVTAVKPKPPKIWRRPLEPTDLTRDNYTEFVSEYNVQDAEPYPDEIIRVSTALAEAPGAGGGENVAFGKTSDKLKIPKGYHVIDIYGLYTWGGYPDKYFAVLIAGKDFVSANAKYVEGIIPVSVNGWATNYNVNIVAKCELKKEAKEAWQLKTYQSIMNAYENALADYNEQIAAAEIQSGIAIQGRNPKFNRTIEKEELRKGALRMLTNNFAKTKVSGNWRYSESFNAMRDNQNYSYPEFDIDEAQVEGKIIQFFEQAFEWNNITYRFYPYFWGRKNDWDETYGKEDTDTNFTDFLRAGAARVVVPVHPAYTEAILHYMHTNEIWNGGEPPTLDDPLFISIVDEIKSDTNADLGANLPSCSIDSGYPCLADEWDVKVPTNLVYLQKDSDLPDFTTPE